MGHMQDKLKKRIILQLDRLSEWAPRIATYDWNHAGHSEEADAAEWHTECQILLSQLGEPWKERADISVYSPEEVSQLQGVLRALRTAIQNGFLAKLEDLVLADAFDSLLEQAEELLQKNYLLAAGTLGRAVLEEHLRKLCQHHGCMPNKSRPTINDLNQSLKSGGHYHKHEFKQVDSLAGKGNHCAHNVQPPLSQNEIELFLVNLRAFLASHPLS